MSGKGDLARTASRTREKESVKAEELRQWNLTVAGAWKDGRLMLLMDGGNSGIDDCWTRDGQDRTNRRMGRDCRQTYPGLRFAAETFQRDVY